MSRKILIVDPEQCGGCRTCELICSWSHNPGVVRPVLSRIHVMKDERLGIEFPMVCQQCEKPPCRDVCPVEAISRHKETGAMLINQDICIGCRACLAICPYGAIGVDPERFTMFKCDLCDGDPKCVKWCPREAIKYEKAEIASSLKQRAIFEERLKKPLVEGTKA